MRVVAEGLYGKIGADRIILMRNYLSLGLVTRSLATGTYSAAARCEYYWQFSWRQIWSATESASVGILNRVFLSNLVPWRAGAV